MKTFLLVLAFSVSAMAGTDQACVQQCKAGGGGNYACFNQCTTADPNPFAEPSRSTDYRCVQQCTSNGYAYGLCQSRCSY